MAGLDTIRGVLIGIILIAVGWVMGNSAGSFKLIGDIGWIFLFGGIAVAGLSAYSAIRR